MDTTFAGNLRKVLRQNIREYGMYIALVVIMLFFTFATGGKFFSPRNISDLINQMGYIAVIAVGMTLVIVIRHIDLSVGFLAGFMGAIAAIAMVTFHVPWFVTVLIVLLLGILVGVLNGFLVASVGIPAFVATLAGWLAFRGALQAALAGTGTIIVPNETFNAISNGFIPDFFPAETTFLPGIHKLTLVLGALAIVFMIIGSVNDRKTKRAYNFEVLPKDMFVLQLVFISLVVAGITYILAAYQGLSWTAVVVIAVVLIYNFITNRTVLGRHIYAVGGNPEAAALSGINVNRITYLVFMSMGLLSALGGILIASRFRSATPTAGTLLELDAIAAAYVGGVSAAGGVGKVTGSIIGALVMASLVNGMALMGVDQSIQYLVRAAVLALAVIFDV
ncbi:sugar ABC transporter permease, partial [bacterium]|nr:sugar ABC transporter permease [bacterium]